MFSQSQPIQVTLKSIYTIRRHTEEFAVADYVRRRTPHKFHLSVRGKEGAMTVDDVEESFMPFHLIESEKGAFSLASSGARGEAGAFCYVRLTANGETLLNIDFTKLQSVEELEEYFDCYYFSALNCNVKGELVSIRNHWELNEHGHLVCLGTEAQQISFGDNGPFFLLTMRGKAVKDFEVEVGFEQCWRRYGIVFGLEERHFPYYWLPNTYLSTGVRGALAFVNAHDGSGYIRGALIKPEDGSPICRVTQDMPQQQKLFSGKEQSTLLRHTLTYHIKSSMLYHTPHETLQATAGSVVYLPPNTPCRLEGEKDEIIRIEFDCDRTFPPSLIHPKQPEMLRRIFVELHSTWHSNLVNKNYRALACFYRIMAEISLPTAKAVTANTIREVLQYIHHHFAEPTLSVKEVAKQSGMCESAFYQTFHQTCGMTPKAYILNCRLHHACALLQTQDIKIYEVAEKSGFADVKYFMTAFKREMGISPGKFKKLRS